MLLLFLNRFPRSSFAWSSLLTTFDTKITCSIKLSGRSSICSSNIASRQQYLPPLMSHLALRRSPGLRLPSPPPGAVSRQRPAAGRGSRGRALRKAGGARGLRAAGAGRRSVTGSRFVDGKPCELRLCLALRVQHVNEHRRDPTKVSMWRLAARVLLGTKVHPVTRRLLAGAANLQCCWWGTARRTYTGYMSAGIRKVEAPDAEHLVRVQWEDGSESCYPCVWLRDNCQCPHCFLHSAKARKLLFEDLDVDIVAKEVTLTDRRKISITWPDEHTSEYEAEWLKKRCFSEAARAEMREDLFLPGSQWPHFKATLCSPPVSPCCSSLYWYPPLYPQHLST